MSSVLTCLNLNKNDEVLVSNYTMVATANVVKFAGLKVKLVDIHGARSRHLYFAVRLFSLVPIIVSF